MRIVTILRIVLPGLSVFLYSCATMVRGTTESINLNSTPQGALATLSTGHSCLTPCFITMDRDATFNVTFSKENCQDELLSVFPTLAGGGILLGGIVDYATGAVYSLRPNPAVATLTCFDVVKQPADALPTTNQTTKTRLNELNNLRDEGLLSPEEYDRKRTEILEEM